MERSGEYPAEDVCLVLLGAVLVTAQGSSIKMIELENSYRYPLAPIAIPVQVQFITQKDIQATGKVTQHYDAALCGGCSFDGLNARFAVNLVNNPWDYDAGDYITVTVLDSAGNVITTNVNESSKIPQPDFNFTYSVKFKNLYFTIVTGPAPSFVFTLSLTFDYKNRVYFLCPVSLGGR
ncbi:hypothetical protein OS493_005973 [Desmophyllum pertusum]|uniref:Uncharacterized protein n=1 Tax=Desmophyllum pertusum TaxID=174260 RepID=A0A9W9YFR0_9CNID|nr:hypothetical protein OS493_005973 [Desmophyllum pertusum]